MNIIEIRYCAQCRWLLRACWMMQELLSTFEQEIDQVCIQPGTNGVFEIYANEQRIWCRQQQGGFPEISQLKQLVRDRIAPERSLGCIDKKAR
ncbi:MAG: SelT/SelW/SelH family protein [Ferrimonas sp.]